MIVCHDTDFLKTLLQKYFILEMYKILTSTPHRPWEYGPWGPMSWNENKP